ncbi:MAG: AMP-binding protein [Thermomicrobiales bacterium]
MIVTPGRQEGDPANVALLLTALGSGANQVQLVIGPLYHATSWNGAYLGLFYGHTLVIMDRFDAAHAVDLIERHRIEWIFCASTAMQRIANLPGVREHDFSSLRGIASTAAPCPPWLKRAWFDLPKPREDLRALLDDRGHRCHRHPGR